MMDEAAQWLAVQRRDAAADGAFFYSVRTTGVYCRPSCASRPARRQNVAFHGSCEDAERAGFRPCRRCRPDQPSQAERRAALVAGACRQIDIAEDHPTLESLAATAGLSPFHFHRVFKAATGLTPKAYAAARRAGRVRASLEQGTTVTESLYEAGFGSSGRFYAASSAMLGMKPAVYGARGTGMQIRFAVGDSSLGCVLVAATPQGVCSITLGDDADALLRDLQRRFARAEIVPGDAAFATSVTRAVALVEAPGQGLDLPMDVRGTAFQQRVWQALRDIPAGSTATYSQIAAQIGAPTAARAVALACGANPVAVAIPCHRVVAANGTLSGYRWGIERKRALLAREGGG